MRYLTHDLKEVDVAMLVVTPDPEELVTVGRYGHFADYHARSHVAVDETGGWGPTCDMSKVEEDEDMPTPEAQEMFAM